MYIIAFNGWWIIIKNDLDNTEGEGGWKDFEKSSTAGGMYVLNLRAIQN